MDASQLQRTLADFTDGLFLEGFLDSQFTQLQELQDESNPNFVFEVISLFFDDSEGHLIDLALTLQDEKNIDYTKVHHHVHQLKGSSSSIGAQRVRDVCIRFLHCCQEKNLEECMEIMQQLKNEFNLVKNKLKTFFMMERQISATAHGPISNKVVGNAPR